MSTCAASAAPQVLPNRVPYSKSDKESRSNKPVNIQTVCSTSNNWKIIPGELFFITFTEFLIICGCRYQRQESSEEKTNQKPHFIRPLQDLGELQEGRNAHFEAQLTPVSDPTMKVRLYQACSFIIAPNTIITRWSGTKMDDPSPPVAGLPPSSTSATCLSI